MVVVVMGTHPRSRQDHSPHPQPWSLPILAVVGPLQLLVLVASVAAMLGQVRDTLRPASLLVLW